MTDALRVSLEIGPKGRRVVAGATDWPGLERWGKTEGEAVAALERYVPRYAAVAARAGLGTQFGRLRGVAVFERYPGNSSTDYWGIAHVPSPSEREVLPEKELERRLALLDAIWAYFDATAARVSADLRLGPRGGGWTRDELIRHVLLNEPEQFSRKVEVRTPREAILSPDGLAMHRAQYLDAIRAYNADGRTAGRSWSVRFLIRRTAQHAMDHAWEMEDRDLTDAE